MFYRNKILYFLILYILSLGVCYFVDKQIVLVDFLSNLFITALIIYVCVISATFILAKLLTYTARRVTRFYCRIAKKRFKFHKNFVYWIIFTGISYILIFLAFFKAIQY